MTGALARFCLLAIWGLAACAWAAPAAGPLYILQANDLDLTAPSSQPVGRWYHWLGCDPAVTHLETGLAIDSAAMAGRGQRIELAAAAPVAAIQVKLKRIGRPVRSAGRRARPGGATTWAEVKSRPSAWPSITNGS